MYIAHTFRWSSNFLNTGIMSVIIHNTVNFRANRKISRVKYTNKQKYTLTHSLTRRKRLFTFVAQGKRRTRRKQNKNELKRVKNRTATNTRNHEQTEKPKKKNERKIKSKLVILLILNLKLFIGAGRPVANAQNLV